MAANEMEDDDSTPGLDMFKEPDDFYEPEKQPTSASYTMLDGREIKLQLVGHSPLWGHHLWQSALSISRFLEQNSQLLTNRTVLELGAAAGLPSIIAYLKGASLVLATDYPDQDLIDNLCQNLASNCLSSDDKTSTAAVWGVEGYLWGAPTEKLSTYLDKKRGGFDILILADLLFNHSEHGKLIISIQRLLRKPHPEDDVMPQALVFFTPYRPWLLDKDIAFFDLAREGGLKVEQILEEKMEKVMFEEDRGDEELRRTVFGYRLTWV